MKINNKTMKDLLFKLNIESLDNLSFICSILRKIEQNSVDKEISVCNFTLHNHKLYYAILYDSKYFLVYYCIYLW